MPENPQIQGENSIVPGQPVLWGPDGKPISTAGAMVTPTALNVAQIIQLPGRLYSFRWDEAMRENPENALSMRRDVYYQALLQERWAPTINLEWQVEVDNPNDPQQKLVKEGLGRVWNNTPDKFNLIRWLLQAEWFGRSGQQCVWDRQAAGEMGWVAHDPVHGDGIQFAWDGTPAVLVSWYTAQKYRVTDPHAVIPATDRGAFAIRLYKPEYRRRFVIHKYWREAADYYEGEMSGGVHGVGLRSYLYWAGWMRTEVFSWMISFMQSTGMMDLIILNYEEGNAKSLAQAEANARKISGKLVLLVPRTGGVGKTWPAAEQLQMNTAGIEVLKQLIEGMFDKYIQMLITGQSMSTGNSRSDGLGSAKFAELAQDTKYQLIKTSGLALGETLSRDYIEVAKELNYRWADFPVRLVPVLKDPQSKEKMEFGKILVDCGVEIEEDEFRMAGGYSKPKEGAKTVKKQETAPVFPGGGMDKDEFDKGNRDGFSEGAD